MSNLSDGIDSKLSLMILNIDKNISRKINKYFSIEIRIYRGLI